MKKVVLLIAVSICLGVFLPALFFPAILHAQSDMPGDACCDSALNISDPAWLLHHFFQGCETSPMPCDSPLCNPNLLNVDGDSIIDFTDFWYLASYVFTWGDPPLLFGSAPYPPADPGQRDTVQVEVVYASPGSSFQLDIHISQDESVAISLPLAFADTLIANCDSAKVINPGSEYFLSACDYECQGTKGLFFFTAGAQFLLRPNVGATFRIYGAVSPAAETGMVWLDTVTLAIDKRLSFTWFDTGVVNANRARRLLPEFIRGGVHIVSCVSKPGDANGDGQRTLSDVIHLVNYVFDKSRPPTGCLGSDPGNCWTPDPLCRGEVNGTSPITLADVIYLVNYVFDKSRPDTGCQSSDPVNCWTPVSTGECCLP